MRRCLLPLLCLATALLHAQQPVAPDAQAEAAPLPDIRQLLLDVERRQRLAEEARKDYTYHVHTEQQELNGRGELKKTDVTDAESLTINGVRVNRVVARDGRPLTPDEVRKENERLDKLVARDKERRAKLEGEGKQSDSRGDEMISASRILELGVFTNPRRMALNGRSTIVLDYVGDPHAKTRNSAEVAIRDLAGTVWVDERERALVRGEGHMLNDFKVGGGLLLDVHKGFSFSFEAARVNGEVWLPARIDAHGSARYLLFGGVNGSLHLTASDYRKFRATSTIVEGSEALAPDDGSPQTRPAQPAQPPK